MMRKSAFLFVSAVLLGLISQTVASGASNPFSISSLLTQRNLGGGVLVEATLLSPREIGEVISFRIKLDTASEHLDPYNLSLISGLWDDAGTKFPSLGVIKSEGAGHHKSGIITFSNMDRDNKPILTSKTRYIELHVRGVAAVEDRVFRWELEP